VGVGAVAVGARSALHPRHHDIENITECRIV